VRLTFAEQDRKIIPVQLGLLVLSACGFAQHLPTGKPESVDLSSERLERMGTALQHDIDDTKLQAPSPW
jgi:hypothetical protein